MNRTLLIVGSVLLLACAALSWVAKSQYDRATGLESQNRELAQAVERAQTAQKAADKALVAKSKMNAATARETAVKQRSVDVAKAANPDWSKQPVPQEVQDAIRD
jgi:hypothetical protein